MKPAIAPPLLPYPSGNTVNSLQQFDADLRRALVDVLTQYALRINGSLPKDGSEEASMVHINGTADVTPTSWDTDPFHIGTQTGGNVAIDLNEIMARSNGAVAPLNLNADGGEVTMQLNNPNVGLGLRFGQAYIKFPATQVPSADANALDDYEEGTWTPTFTFSGGNTGITYSVQTGVYVKIGQLVFVQGRIILTSKGSSTGAARIASLPFTANGASHNYTPISVGYYQNFVALPGALTGYVEINNTYINLVAHGATGIGGLNDTHISNTTDIIFSAVYRAGA